MEIDPRTWRVIRRALWRARRRERLFIWIHDWGIEVLCWSLAVIGLALLLVPLAAAAQGDTAPPVLVSATPDRQQIDTDDGPQLVRVSVHITDDLSGLQNLYIAWRHEYGANTTRNCQFQLYAEGHRDVRAECLLEFPQHSAAGRWLVDHVGMRDRVGNEGNINALILDVDRGHWDYRPDAAAIVKDMEILIGESVIVAPTALPPVLFLAAVRR